MPRKAKVTSAPEKKLTNAGFVRSLPVEMTPEQVIEAGKKKGLEIKTSDIHSARYYMRQQAEKNGKAKGKPKGKAATPAAAAPVVAAPVKRVGRPPVSNVISAASFEQLQKEAILLTKKLGTVQMRSVLDQVEAGAA